MRNRMIIGPLLMAAALAVLILSCNKPKGGQAADAQAGQPRTGKIEVPVESFDFGDVNRGDTANYTFAIKNATNKPLKLVRAKGSWGCAAAIISKADVPPGGEGKVEVKLATAGKSGKVTKLITVETDDPVTPKLTLTVTANIVVDVDFERPSLGFPSLKMGEQTSSAMPILAKDPAGLEFGEVTSDIQGLTAKLVKGEKEGKPSWSLDVSFKPEKVGSVSGTVKLQVKKPKETELMLRISGRVEGNIKIMPSVVSLRKPADPKQPGTSVTLKADKGIFKITKVQEETGKVTVKTETVTAGKEYKLTLSVSDAGLKDERFSTKLVVKTSSKQQPEIEIPVYYSSVPTPFKPGLIKSLPPNLKPGGGGIHPALPVLPSKQLLPPKKP